MLLERTRRTITPAVDVTDAAGGGVRIIAKFEGANPGHSIKDRTAGYMLREALRRNRHLDTIIEASSGNTGVSLAMMTGVMGLRTILFVPESGRRKAERARDFGAIVIHTPDVEGTEGSQQRARRTAEEMPGAIYLNQHENPANELAHYRTTGPEILAQAGRFQVLVAGIGTGGTLAGTARFLQESNPGLEVLGVVPEADSYIPGLRPLDPSGASLHRRVSRYNTLTMDYDRVVWWQKRIMNRCGLPAGPSSGAAMAAAVGAARGTGVKKVVVIFPDHAENY